MYMGKVYKGRREMGGIGERCMDVAFETWQWIDIERQFEDLGKKIDKEIDLLTKILDKLNDIQEVV